MVHKGTFTALFFAADFISFYLCLLNLLSLKILVKTGVSDLFYPARLKRCWLLLIKLLFTEGWNLVLTEIAEYVPMYQIVLIISLGRRKEKQDKKQTAHTQNQQYNSRMKQTKAASVLRVNLHLLWLIILPDKGIKINIK